MTITEVTWKTEDVGGVIHALRDRWRASGHGVAAIDPGSHGGLAVQGGGTRLHPLGDDRAGGIEEGARLAVAGMVTVLLCETAYAPRVGPHIPAQAIGGIVASAIKTARSGGFALGYLAGALSRHDVLIVLVQPQAWQGWSLDLGNRATREERKKASLARAQAEYPALLAAIPRAPDREGCADALGLLDWWLTAPMVRSPLR